MSQAPYIAYFQPALEALNNPLNLLNDLRRDLLGARLVDLVLLHAPQVGGCASCIDIYWTDLIRMGEDPRHLNIVAGWCEVPFLTERKRDAALRWAELATGTPRGGTSDERFAWLREHFSDEEIAGLSFVIVTTNSWDLLNVSLRNPVSLRMPYVVAA